MEKGLPQTLRRKGVVNASHLALQMMFVEANKSYAPEMANIAEQLLPDEARMTALPTAFSSSRTLPGQSYFTRERIASGEKPVTSL